jgi:CheY-like chemotaxis protein
MADGRSGCVDVLLVEDDPTVADMYRLRLEADGCTVAVAGTGEIGLTMAGERPPNVVLLDYRLPGLNGSEVLRALRADARTRHVPVLMLSAYDEPALVDQGIADGAAAWLVKSQVTLRELVHQVQRWAGLELPLG